MDYKNNISYRKETLKKLLHTIQINEDLIVKAFVKKGNWLDLPMRYAPYKGKLNSIKRLLDYI